MPIGKGVLLKEGHKIAVISIGTVAYEVQEAISRTEQSDTIGHYDMPFLKPLDEALFTTTFLNCIKVLLP